MMYHWVFLLDNSQQPSVCETVMETIVRILAYQKYTLEDVKPRQNPTDGLNCKNRLNYQTHDKEKYKETFINEINDIDIPF